MGSFLYTTFPQWAAALLKVANIQIFGEMVGEIDDYA